MKYAFTFILILLVVVGFAQSEPQRLLSLAQDTLVWQYDVDKSKEYVQIPSQFADDTLASIDFSHKRIVRIDYVASAFSVDPNFDQRKLDAMRFQRLLLFNPQLSVLDHVPWYHFVQSGCDSPQSCQDFFHGFVVYFESTEEDKHLEELAYLTDYLTQLDDVIRKNSNEKFDLDQELGCELPEPAFGNSDFAKYWKRKRKRKIKYPPVVDFTLHLNNNGDIDRVELEPDILQFELDFFKTFVNRNRWYPAKVDGRRVGATLTGKFFFPLKQDYSIVYEEVFLDPSTLYDTILYEPEHCYCYRMDEEIMEELPKVEPYVSNPLLRNGWKNVGVVMDLTGSMAPYTADLMTWLRLSAEGAAAMVVFFNDGDNRPQKPIGKTEGIYKTINTSFGNVKRLMALSMNKGWGAPDLPENNIEALLVAAKSCEECKTYVMIADNYAFPRDVELLDDFEGTLEIILCGTEHGINTQWMDLARKYQFGLHTKDDDVVNLSEVTPGQKIMIDQKTYRLVDGNFKRFSF